MKNIPSHFIYQPEIFINILFQSDKIYAKKANLSLTLRCIYDMIAGEYS